MKIDWTKNLKDTDEQESFRQQIFSSRQVLERMTDLLNEWESALDRSEIDPTVFNIPNWPYLQAYKNGYRAGLTKMKELINIT